MVRTLEPNTITVTSLKRQGRRCRLRATHQRYLQDHTITDNPTPVMLKSLKCQGRRSRLRATHLRYAQYRTITQYQNTVTLTDSKASGPTMSALRDSSTFCTTQERENSNLVTRTRLSARAEHFGSAGLVFVAHYTAHERASSADLQT